MRVKIAPLAACAAFLVTAAQAEAQPLIYVSDVQRNAVLVYSQTGAHQSPIAEITAGIRAPVGLAVDSEGTLYVANNSGTVTAYASGSKTPSRTYSRGLHHPFSVTVGRDGTVYVSDFDGNTANGSVVEYPRGSTTPALTLHGFGPQGPGFTVVTPANNLLVVPQLKDPSRIDEFLPHSASEHTLGAVIQLAMGMAFDTHGNLAVADFLQPGILIYPQGHANPSRLIVSGMVAPGQIVFDHSRNELYIVQDAFGFPPLAEITVLSYPAGRVINSITSGLRQPTGVALSPAAF